MSTACRVLPPPDEQRAIADYLDHETAQIDALVAKQEEFIATSAGAPSASVDDADVSSDDRGQT